MMDRIRNEHIRGTGMTVWRQSERGETKMVWAYA